MSQPPEDFISLEEIQNISKIIAQKLTEDPKIVTDIATHVIPENQITQMVNLDVIASSVHGITDILGQIADWFRSVLSSISNWIVSSVNTFVAGIRDVILGAINTLSIGIQSFINTATTNLANFFNTAITSATNTINGVIKTIQTSILSSISGITSTISSLFSSMLSSVSSMISGIATSLGSMISGVTSSLSSMISGMLSSVMSGISGIITSVSSIVSGAISSIASTIMSIASSITSTISSMLSGVSSSLMSALSTLRTSITSVISGIISSITSAISSISSSIMSAMSSLGSSIMSGISSIVNTISSMISGVATNIGNIVSGIVTTIINTVSNALSAMGKTILDSLSVVGKNITDFFGNIGNQIMSGVQRISDLFGTIGKQVTDGFTNVGKWFTDTYNFLVSSFQDIASKVGAGFNAISEAFMGFVNAILRLPEMLIAGFQKIGEWIWNALPKWLRDALEAIGKFFTQDLVNFFTKTIPEALGGLFNAINEFFKDPIKNLQQFADMVIGSLKWLAEKIWEGLKWLGNMIWEGLKGLWTLISNGISWLGNSLWSLISGMTQSAFSATISIFQSIATGVLKIAEGFISFILTSALQVAETLGNILTAVVKQTVEPMGKMIGEAVEKPFRDLIDKYRKGEETRGEFIELFSLGGTFLIQIISSQYMARGLWIALHAMAMPLERVSFTLPVRIKVKASARGKGKATPVGVGAEAGGDVGGETESGVEQNITINLGYVMRHIAREAKRYGDTFGRALIYGLGIWWSQPMTRLANSAFRNWMVVEMPTMPDLIEIVRRHMPTEKFEDFVEICRGYMRLYGYNDSFINWVTNIEEAIEIKDRFETMRKIPISLIYELPSPSDVARMVIRDIFGVGRTAIESFLKVYKARGMHEDVGALYYMLHYRYPPPERLWSFTVRGLSKMLWATQPQKVFEAVKQELEYLKAPVPTDARYWNADTPQKARSLLSAFNYYMSWHDYFMGTWLKKEIIDAPEHFTSDNQIIIDTLADIPTKIDQRWMIKWGLYEHLKKYNVTIDSEVKDFIRIVDSAKAQGALELDLSNFCRTLQSTGLHPYWIPITAVAETMNVLTEERTLIRSGAQALFKEGLLTIDRLEKIITDAIIIGYHVAYFDLDEARWKEGYINMPVMFLPAERELIKYRAYMDRALDIVKEIQRDISNAYQDAIIVSETEYVEKLTRVIEDVNSFMPTNIKLAMSKEYYDPYIKALDIYKEVYTVRRIRSWTMRWLGWIMYRVATGLVTDEELSKMVETLVGYSKLTNTERQFFTDVFKAMKGIAMREYAPTPSQLATLAEYMPISDELIDKSFTIKMVTPEWQGMWKQYIKIRPIVDDVKALITTYRRALLYAKIPPEVEKQILALAQEIGYTERELAILGLRVQLEELIMSSKEFMPSPSTLATLAEYVALPEELIRKALDAKRVPPEWISIWLTYVRTKPIKSDVKSLLSVYIRALKYKAITKDEVEAFIKTLPQYGFSQDEINFIIKRIQLEETIMSATTTEESYIPTLTTLATFSEYMTIPDNVIKAVFESRGVTTEWQEFWTRYIKVKPLADDIRGLLSTYRRVVLYITIPDDVKKKIEDYANLIGFTQVEWEILNLRTQLEEMLLNSKEYIPTPSMLASLCEYIPEAREFFKDVMTARRVPEKWQAIWAKYIDIRPLVDDVKRYLSRAETLYVRFMVKKADFEKILDEVVDYLGYTQKEAEFLMKITDFERYRNAWTELIGTVDRLVELSEYSPRASKFALGKVNEMIDALPITPADKQELKTMWEEYIRNRPVKSEAKLYVTQIINAYVEGLITQADFYRELDNMKKWGFSDAEIEFYKAQAEVRKARKLKIPLVYGE